MGLQLALGILSNALCFTGWGTLILLPLFQEQQGLPRWQIGLVAGVYSLVGIVSRLRLGVWIGRWGYRPFIVGGAGLSCLCTLSFMALPVAAGPQALARGLQGTAISFCFTAGWARVVASAPADRVNEVTGWFGISGLVGGALGPILGEAVLRHSDFPHVFLAGGALGVTGALLTLALRDAHHAPGSPPAPFLRLLRRPELRGMVLGSLLFGVANGTFVTFIAPYVARCQLPGVGVMLALYYTASVSIRLKLGRESDRLGPARLILPGLLLMGTGTAALGGLTPHGWYLLLGAGVLIGLGHGLTYPALSTLANRRVAATGAATSLFMACVESGVLLGATGSGWVAGQWGYHLTFLGVGLTVLAGGLGFFLLEGAGNR